MAVMARESWTDERIDDLKEQMNERFDQVDKRFDRVEGDIRELRVAVTGMQRTMTQSTIAICTIMLTGFGTLIGLAAF